MTCRSNIVAIVLALAAATAVARPAWDSEENIRAAVQHFIELQKSSGNEEVVRKTHACYAVAHGAQDEGMRLEYCVAFDAANIEFTSFFYENMARKYGQSSALGLQPEATRRPVGRARIVLNVRRANVEKPEELARSIYARAARVLADVLLADARP